MPNEIYYKDVRIPQNLAGIIDYMPDVEVYREELHNLGSQWDLLTILGQMSGTGTDMTGTRHGFQRLTSELLSQLGLETLKKTIQDVGNKAQVAVDIVIRNLFERTADIGFLATDDDIREFLKVATTLNRQLDKKTGADAQKVQDTLAEHVADIQARFQEYVDKYSVYFNIILMDTEGNVLAQLDPDNDIQHSTDPLINEALTTNEEYIEIFRHSDLLQAQDESLIYAYRVTESNDAGSDPLGVLCLCFRFENEMQGVFKNLSNDGDWSVITLLDKTGRVIASSDKYHVPLGAMLPFDLNAEFKATHFAGREYLAKTCATKGYQGFFGLGWYGHVMLPIDHAFENDESVGLKQRVDELILDAVMNDPRLFSEALRSIPVQAEFIQRELERTVWNGNVRESDAQSKVLLWNISDAGARTKMVFEKSIGNLHETVVSGLLSDVEFQAALAVDIMDRNLYERANDCRWWALTSAFRSILTQPEATRDIETITSILAYINGLYTVYTNLFVYDASGKILAVSNPSEARITGTTLNEDWVTETLALQGSQSYSVSPFKATSLYGNRHTYVYGAAITDPNNPNRCVGGIGIVFDSEPQFQEMLQDSLPHDEQGNVVSGCFGIFVDRSGQIISATDERFKTGEHLEIDKEFFTLPNGEGMSKIIEFHGHYYAVGARTSAGYREYKVNDDYTNDVIGMAFVPLAETSGQAKHSHRRREVGIGVRNSRGHGGDCIEVATFYVGNKWLGINSNNVKEAINPDNITSIPGANDFVVGKTMYEEKVIYVLDIRNQLEQPRTEIDSNSSIIVVDAGDTNVGIIVDALGEIPEICIDRVDVGNSVLDSSESYIECIIKPEAQADSKELLVVLDPQRLLKSLMEGNGTKGKKHRNNTISIAKGKADHPNKEAM